MFQFVRAHIIHFGYIAQRSLWTATDRPPTPRMIQIDRLTEPQPQGSQAWYQDIVEAQDEWVCCLGPDGSLRYANPASLGTFDLQRIDMPGQGWWSMVHPGDAPGVQASLAQLSPANPLVEIESRVFTAQGTVVWARFSCRGLFESAGQLVEIRAVGRDISDRKRAHRELETFSHAVSHDLRAPLRAVNGFAAILLEDYGTKLPAECVALLERIREAGTRMGTLVDVLLSLSHLELGRIPDQQVDQAGLVQDVFAALQALNTTSSPTLVVHALPVCLAQPLLLRQVWQNLISNAIKHSRHRADARIEVGCDSAGPVPVYYVRDNGAGFDHQRPGASLDEGQGVGLAIVQRIVERKGGRIWAQSQPGAGATFHFTLAPESSRA